MKLVQEIGAVLLGVGTTPIGILAADYSTWAWCVRAMGMVKWMLRGYGLPGWMERDSVRYKIENSVERF